MLNASHEIRNKFRDGSSVKHRSGHTLSYEEAVALGEIPRSSSVAALCVLASSASFLVFHGINTAHTTICLDELTFMADKILAWRLGGSSKETTHHHRR